MIPSLDETNLQNLKQLQHNTLYLSLHNHPKIHDILQSTTSKKIKVSRKLMIPPTGFSNESYNQKVISKGCALKHFSFRNKIYLDVAQMKTASV